MSLRDLFEMPEQLSRNQQNWLKMCAAIPSAKRALGEMTTEADIALAGDAQNALAAVSAHTQPEQRDGE